MSAQAVPSAHYEAVSFQVDSMMCTSCSTTIEKTLRDLQAEQVVADPDPNSKWVNFRCLKDNTQPLLEAFKKKYTIQNLKTEVLQDDETLSDKALYYDAPTHTLSVRPYLLKALLAAIVGMPLLILDLCNVIPHPMGLATQLLNIGIGLITLTVILATSFDSFKTAWRDFKDRTAGMHTLVVLGLSITWVFSMIICVAPQLFPMGMAHAHFSSIPIMLMVVNIGQALNIWAEKKAKAAAGTKQTFFDKYQLKRVEKIDDLSNAMQRHTIDYIAIRPGDYLVVPPGQAIPADGHLLGKIMNGVSDPDEPIQINTEIKDGEKTIKEKYVGRADGKVCSGMFNGESVPIVMVATERATRSHVCKLYQALKQPQAEAPSLTDTFSRYFTPVLMGLALVTFIAWIAIDPISGWALGVPAMVNVLMCACPCALALAGPLAHYAATQRALKENIVVRNGTALERLSRVTHVVFDKTGTLTTLTLDVDKTQISDPELLSIAALEQGCTHPIAEAILNASNRRESALPVEGFCFTENGRTASVDGKRIAVGNWEYVSALQRAQGINDADDSARLANIDKPGAYFMDENGIIKPLYFKQTIRPETQPILQFFKNRNIAISLATGDASSDSGTIAKTFDIDSTQVHTHCTPGDKAELIQGLQDKGHTVLMVGDGGNDALALNKADIGICIGRSEISEYGQIILPNHLNGIPALFEMGQKTFRTVRANLCFTLVFNVLSIVLAAGILFPLMGVLMHPAVMCTAMLLSSLFVMMSAAVLSYQLKDEDERQRNVAIAQQANLLETLKKKLAALNLFEKILVTGVVLFTALTLTGVVYASFMGMGLTHLIGMMSMPMTIAGCAGCATLLSGLVGLGVVLLVAAVYVAYLLYRENHKSVATVATIQNIKEAVRPMPEPVTGKSAPVTSWLYQCFGLAQTPVSLHVTVQSDELDDRRDPSLRKIPAI